VEGVPYQAGEGGAFPPLFDKQALVAGGAEAVPSDSGDQSRCTLPSGPIIAPRLVCQRIEEIATETETDIKRDPGNRRETRGDIIGRHGGGGAEIH
jgi:hypothetical protein